MADRFAPSKDASIERGRIVAEGILAAGGTVMDATLAWITTSFDGTGAAPVRVSRKPRSTDDAPRTVVVIDSLPRRHPSCT